METAVTVRHLCHAFGRGDLRKPVLDDVNLDVYKGEIVIMRGPSGSGKTTLLTLMGGLRSIQSGSVRVFGRELYGASKPQLVKIRQQIGFIFQSHNLLESLSALQNVGMSLRLHEYLSVEERIAKSQEILTAVGLANRINYYPDKLSGGQKQRVAIARALVAELLLTFA